MALDGADFLDVVETLVGPLLDGKKNESDEERRVREHAGEIDPTAVGLLAELPDRIEAPGLPSRSTPTFGAPEKVL
jgi:hypothetical protein